MAIKGSVGVNRTKIEALFEQDDWTIDRLAETMGLSRSAIVHHIASMHSAKPKVIHVCGHHRRIGKGRGGHFTRIYALGDKPDVPDPKKDHVENCRRYREKHSAIVKARRRAKMAPDNPFLVTLCSMHLSSLRVRSLEKTQSQPLPTSQSETDSSEGSTGSFAWGRPSTSTLLASLKQSRSRKPSKSAKA